MSHSPAASVVVPFYNEPRVARAIASVLNQTFTNFELLVVDDGSTDGSPGIVRTLRDCRIRPIGQRNQGAGAARNRGLASMRSPLCAFLDADDEWRPDHLERLVAMHRLWPSAGLLATGFRIHLHHGLVLERTIDSAGPRLVHDYFRMAVGACFVHTSAAAITGAALRAAGPFMESETLGEDLELYARVLLEFPLAYDPAISSVYHSDAAQSLTHRARLPEIPPVVRTLAARLQQNRIPARIRPSVLEYVAGVRREHGIARLIAGARSSEITLPVPVRLLPRFLVRLWFRAARCRLFCQPFETRAGVLTRVVKRY